MSRMRVLAHVVGVVAALVALVYVARPTPHIPLYDANLVRLAETEREGYCSGIVFWRTQGFGDADQAALCREEHPGKSGEFNPAAAQRGFCEAIVESGWEDTASACVGILEQYQYWPTYDGSITDQWNRARQYPQPAIRGSGGSGSGDGSRTGGREDTPARGGYGGYYGG